MTKPAGERWVFTMHLPANLPNVGRFVARLLKHLLRAWGVKCVAVAEPDEVKHLRQLVNSLTDRCARLTARAEKSHDSTPVARSAQG